MIKSIVCVILLVYSPHILAQMSSTEKVEQLVSFAKLYGYVKYFHPSDEAAELDWDAFAIYGVQKILDSDSCEIKQTLQDLFKPIAPTVKILCAGEKNDNLPKPFFVNKNSLDTIHWQHVGNGNFNSLSSYKSIRTERPRIIFPFAYYRERFFLPLNMINNEGEYKIEYSIRNSYSDYSYRFTHGLEINNVVSEKRNSYNRNWRKYTRMFKISKRESDIGLFLSPQGKGCTQITPFNIFKKNGDAWEFISELNLNSKVLEKLVNKTDMYTSESLYNISIEDSLKGIYPKLLNFNYKSIQLPDTNYFSSNLKYGDLIKIDLNDNLHAEIPLVLLSYKDHTLNRVKEDFINQLRKNLDSIVDYKNINVENLSVRLGNVINTWNSLIHFYPYLSELNLDTDQILLDALKNSFLDQDDEDHKNRLKLLLSHFNDSHIEVLMNNDPKRFYPNLNISYINGKYFVTN